MWAAAVIQVRDSAQVRRGDSAQVHDVGTLLGSRGVGALLRSATCGALLGSRDVGTLLRSAAWGLCSGPRRVGLCSGPRRVGALLRSATCGALLRSAAWGLCSGPATCGALLGSATCGALLRSTAWGTLLQVSDVQGSAPVRGVGPNVTLDGSAKSERLVKPKEPASEVQSEALSPRLKSERGTRGSMTTRRFSNTGPNPSIVNGEVKQTVCCCAARRHRQRCAIVAGNKWPCRCDCHRGKTGTRAPMPTDNADGPFRTGEPTEKGWYIVRRCGETNRVMIRAWGNGCWWTDLGARLQQDGWMGHVSSIERIYGGLDHVET